MVDSNLNVDYEGEIDDEKKWPKVLVGAPVCGHYEFCWDKYIQGILNIDYPNFEILLVDNSEADTFFIKAKEKLSSIKNGLKIDIVRAGFDEPSIKMKMVIGRNLLCKKALDEGFDYFLNLDQDVVPPSDILKKLVSYKKEIITGVYHNYYILNGVVSRTPILYTNYSEAELENLKKMSHEELKNFSLDVYKNLEANSWNFEELYKQLNEKDIEGLELIEIKMCGTGCIMISRDVMRNIPFRYNQAVGFDDSLFCKEAILNNFKIYADCSILCEHFAKDKPWSWCSVGNEQMILYGANMFKRSM